MFFLNLFSDWLLEAKKNIIVVDSIISEEAITLSFNSLFDIIIEISERVLFVEYNVFIEDITQNEKSDVEKLHAFEKKLLTVNFRKYLLYEYPEFFRLIFENINFFIDNINNIISNYINDFEEIKEVFKITNSEIEYIRMGLGDRHNKNKSTTLLKIIKEPPIILKHRDLAIEVCFSNFLGDYNKSCNTNIYLPKILYRKNYSWSEFIEQSNQKDIKANLLEEIGHILCILYFLNGTDFHYENIIINNEKGLVLIDCESILYPIKDSEINEHNVLSTGLLSNKIEIGDKQIDFGGLNLNNINDTTQEFPLLKEIIGIVNGKLISFEEKSKLIKSNYFLLYEHENINEYIEEILSGFKKSYTFLMNRKKKIISFFSGGTSEFPIRFLIRNTYTYFHVLYESLSPILLTNKNDRINFIKQLKEPYSGSTNILESEISDIYNNDIPYYYCNIKSTTLRSSNGFTKRNFFERSPLNSLLYKLNNKISKRDLEKQLFLIKYNFAQSNTENLKKIFTKKYISNNINFAYEFFKNIVGKSNTYFTLQESYKKPNQYNIEYSNNDLINGKFGDLLFLAEANKIFKNTFISKTIFRLYEKNIRQLHNSKYLGIAGIGGTIYFLLRMYKIYDDIKYVNDALKYIDSLDLTNLIENSQNNGVIYGRAGLLIALIELEKISNSPTINKLTHLTYNRLISSAVISKKGIYWLSEFHKKPLCGVAHGSSGIILALLRYFKLFNDLECKNIIKQAILFENTFYSNNYKNWKDNRGFVTKELKYSSLGWSHGAPGIGLVRLELIESKIFTSEEFLNIIERDLKNCVESTYKSGLNGNDSIIFGKYGNAELLVRFSKYVNNPEFLGKIQNTLNSFNDLYFIRNNKGLIIPGLFNGISGCGYQLLFFNDYIKNSILTFECN